MPGEFNSGTFRPMTGKHSTLRTTYQIKEGMLLEKNSPSRIEVYNIDPSKSSRRMLDLSKKNTMDFKSVASGKVGDRTTMHRNDSNSPSGLGLNTLLS